MTAAFHNRHKVFARLGSFWHQNTAEGFDRDFARALSRMPDVSAAPVTMESAVDWLAGSPVQRHGFHEVRFNPSTIKVIGPDLQKRIVEKYGLGTGMKIVVRRPMTDEAGVEGHGSLMEDPGEEYLHLVDDDSAVLLFPMPDATFDIQVDPSVLRPIFVLPWKAGSRPVSLFSATRDMVCGVDYTCVEGGLLFQENPSAIFPGGIIFCREAVNEAAPFMGYTLQGDFKGSGRRVADYLRNRTSVKALELACAEYAGLVIPETGGPITWAAYNEDGSAIYETADQTLRVDYPHVLRGVEHAVDANEVFGEVLKIYGPTAARHQSWYKMLPWNEGLLLDGISPVAGISIYDQPCLAEAYDETGDLIHVRLHLQGEADVLEKFWYRIKRAENAGHTPLNDYFEFSATGETATVNALDFYFDHLLGRRAIIVCIDEERLGGVRAGLIREFIHREKPIGCVVIYHNGTGQAWIDSTVTYLSMGGGVFATSGSDYYLTI